MNQNKNEQKRREMLSERLKELGFTQESFARAVGVSLKSAHRWVVGTQDPKLHPEDTLILCKTLQWSLEELAEAFKRDPS